LATHFNAIVQSLPANAASELSGEVTRFPARRGHILQAAGQKVEQVYFPLGGMVSLVTLTAAGDQVESAIVGKEGIVSSDAALSSKPSFVQAIVQVDGEFLSLAAKDFRALCERHEELRAVCIRYQAYVTIQAHQSATCQALHSLEQRLARWLLQAQDMVDLAKIPLTQEFLSHMLGVQRPTVSIAARALVREAAIEYSRGSVTVLDRKKLTKRSCECHSVLRREMKVYLTDG
jgi:CRP-like cAMP-binding protein